jgi:hypothetical protein
MTRSSGSPINAFLSYAHATEDEYGLIEPLTSSLVNQVKARANRDLKIWKDTDDIPWGSPWRDAIEGGIKGASVLFVLASQHYLDSETCRQEFNEFLQAVEKTGSLQLKRLILPILPVDAPAIFREDSEDEIARVIAGTQYIEIEDAVIEGPQSPAWGRAMKKLSQAFINVVEDVELELSANGLESVDVLIAQGNEEMDADSDPGFIDRMGVIEDEMASMQDEVTKLGEILGDFPGVVGETDLSTATSARQMLTKLAQLARRVAPFASDIDRTGGSIKASSQNMDMNLRSAVVAMKEFQTEEQREQLREQLRSMEEMSSTAVELGTQMTGLLESMRQVESSSVVVRNALRPFRKGISDFRDALRTMQAWGPHILDEASESVLA